MSQQLINLESSLQKLQDEGFELEVRDGLMIVHHIPYLNSEHIVKDGSLAMSLSVRGANNTKPYDHTAYWIGDKPCNVDGTEISSLINSASNTWNGLKINYFLSCKPNQNDGYESFYDKVDVYYKTISGAAFATDQEEAKRIHSCFVKHENESVFWYEDTNSAKSGITGIAAKLKDKRVAIVGIGGTGSYILDLLSKTPVAQIDIYDDDLFNSHNAFRAPGAADKDTVSRAPYKVDYFCDIYSRMHKHIVPHQERVTENNVESLRGMDIVFLCVDSVAVRCFISRHLQNYNVPFIDSGLGLLTSNDAISGQVRVTAFDGANGDHLRDVLGTDDVDVDEDNVYSTNIQIAELNMMAAVLSVAKWKHMLGFYDTDSQSADDNVVYNVVTNKILHETK
jgi:tRNA A37 threonylcarbamoyladenosine dehydratase